MRSAGLAFVLLLAAPGIQALSSACAAPTSATTSPRRPHANVSPALGWTAPQAGATAVLAGDLVNPNT